ncbi:MAG TPA: MBL fold metallo-hydrolase [Gemmatimonadaceae bacterium]|nr:MBL fold metallo-hydrolase [Gemmatimonadaceae bacterium]
MVRVTALGSGSKGNCLVVDLGKTRVAVEAGFGVRMLARHFKAAGIAPESMAACVITHEHLDHIRGASKARDKWRWTLMATPQTFAAAEIGGTARILPTAYRRPTAFGDARITLLPISHDAAAPAAVLIEDVVTGARVGIAQDLGAIPEGLLEAFDRVDVLVIEANHDMGMLRAGPYPPSLQDRVAGPRGHLSNRQCADFVARAAHRDMRAIVLAHLSEQNNTPEIARSTVARALRGSPFRGKLVTAAQHAACSVGDAVDVQYRLL